MKRTIFLTAMLMVLLVQAQIFAQTDELKKFEVAAEFTTLERGSFDQRLDGGVGGRFTYNLNRIFALEAAAYFFPKRCFSCIENGRMTQAVGGVKAGKRFQSWGIFAKARPGVVSFSEGQTTILPAPGPPSFPFQIQVNRQTNFAMDVGAVLEFYPSKRIVTRFDVGDTIIHFKQRVRNELIFDPATNTFNLVPFPTAARTTNNFQFMASVGWRF